MFKKVLHKHWLAWLDKRIPPHSSHALNMRSVFILPSRFGWGFIVMCMCLFLLGTNYQNNLMLLLSYLLLSVMLLTLFYSYQNFAAIALSASSPKTVFANTSAHLTLNRMQHSGYKTTPEGLLQAHWLEINKRQLPKRKDTSTITFDIGNREQRLTVPLLLHTRGEHRLPRITFKSAYPFGLYHCWAHLDFDVKIIVYPEPKAGPVYEVVHNTEDAVGGKEDDRQGNEDFFALTDFIEGEPLNRVAWKQVAKTGNWVVKQFSEQKSDDVFLSLPTNTPLEEGLSALTQKIVSMQSQGLNYGLKLGSATFTPNNSISHMHQCLSALATYPNAPFDPSSAKSSSHASISPAGTLAASLAAQAADNSDFQGRSK
ncbi:uncharacterized protein (DUF58 family) [Alteromonas sp. 76-1]|uniref:DUF58 domain-containing protein n=1 Tax=Alteromonas sp. 76-1 TaxID=2358187 RepID=UPI000FD17953|nr:DUF58 domain-containing protein [Alteromonas sp. 76-1]VEL96486.1 uncharacterized protein (DUF58 family) [Alteromonas sp. 76-1]